VERGELPHWSPDGQWILYRSSSDEILRGVRTLKFLIRIIHPDGSGDRKVIDGTPIAWTPDSKAIFYSPCREWPDKPGHIYLVNIDGTGNKKCLENVEANGYHVDSSHFWDSSGSRITLSICQSLGRQENMGIVVLNRKGEIIADYRERGKVFYYDGQVSWSRDNKTILFSKRASEYQQPYEGGIYKMKDDGTQIRLIIADKAGWEFHSK
jgi:Tol biopolymer transport system component